MAESELAAKVQEMLNEEKWTRATLGTYSVSNLKELDVLLEDANREKATDEIKALCDEHLSHTKNSIVALYISGVVSLMLDFGENKTALRRLAECYESDNRPDDMSF